MVQKGRTPPCGVTEGDSGKLACSFDGDADRIVFHAFAPDDKDSSKSKWILIDGDKIAIVTSLLLAQELQAADMQHTYSLGVVQTAYANGAASDFLKEKGIKTGMAKTGVKYVHHKALEYDIGIYYEANGHGTVIFSDRFLLDVNNRMKAVNSSNSSR